MADYLTLRLRLLVVVLNLGVFYALFVDSTGLWIPTSGLESLWLLSGTSLWFFGLLSAPWFRPPRETLVNSVACLLLLTTATVPHVGGVQGVLEAIKAVGIGWALLIAVVSFVALVRERTDEIDSFGNLLRRFCDRFGAPEIIYTPPALVGILGGLSNRPVAQALLLALWVSFLVCRPFEQIIRFARHFRSERANEINSPAVARIERVDHPNIVRVLLKKTKAWTPGTLHIASFPDGEQRYLLALFTQMQGSEVMGTGIALGKVQEKVACPNGCVILSHDKAKAQQFLQRMSGIETAELAGFTVEDSTISRIRFETSETQSLSEGDVVFAKIRDQQIFYQIVEAQTSEETFDRNPRGTHIVAASQLGSYSSKKGFEKFPWLPMMNQPVFRSSEFKFETAALEKDEFAVGTIPSTNIDVSANLGELIAYHAAVLGVTGTGKTELVFKLIREAAKRGVKIFCVDFTGEYRHRLSDLSPTFPALDAQAVADFEKKLFEVETGAYGAGNEKKALESFIQIARNDVNGKIEQFLENNDTNLAILELSELSNSRASIRITEVFLSAIMSWARNHRKAREILLVLEEAHTIIPETHGAGFDFNTQFVVHSIGQIALQGRKYGVGILVVTQRTALVSKTVLSQCNTFFVHSVIDSTSLNFLQSVLTPEYVRAVPNLKFLEFVAYGKALKTERPVILRREFDAALKAASDALSKPLVSSVGVMDEGGKAADAIPQSPRPSGEQAIDPMDK